MAAEPAINAPAHVVRLLGAPQIEGPEGILEGPAVQRHRVALLALLVLSPRCTASRERVLGLLWPESSTRSARTLLNTAVHAIRQALGARALVTRGQTLCLNTSAVRIDVAEFEAAIRRSDLVRAIELYSGPLLDGLSLPHAVEFEHWHDRERDRLERLYHGALEQHAEAVLRSEGPGAALPWLRRRLACTPTSSHATLLVMQALAAAGDRAGALRAADAHATLLREELDASPDAQVELLADRLRRTGFGPIQSGIRTLETSRAMPVSAGASGEGVDVSSDGDFTSHEPMRGDALEIAAWKRESRPVGIRFHRRSVLLGATATLALGTVIVILGPCSPQPIATANEQLTVIPFENRTGESSLDPYSTWAADIVSSGLADAALTPMTSFQDVALRAMGEDGEGFGYASLSQNWPELTGATLAVRGTYFLLPDSDRIEFRTEIVDVDGTIRSSVPEVHGAIRDVADVMGRLRVQVVGAVAAIVSPGGHQLTYTARGRTPPKLEAHQALLEGWEVFAKRQWAASVPFLKKAVELDSTYFLPLIVLRSAYMNLGRQVDVQSVCAVMEERIEFADRGDRLHAAWRCPSLRGEGRSRIEIARDLAELQGSIGSYLSGLALIDASRHAEAIEAFARYDTACGSICREWESVNSSLWAVSLHALGRHSEEVALVRDALARFPHEERLLTQEVAALIGMGELDEAVRQIDDLVDTAAADRSPVELLMRAGEEFNAHGQARLASTCWERALAWLEARPLEKLSSAINRQDRVEILIHLGRTREADSLLAHLLVEFPNGLRNNGLRGVLEAMVGDTGTAIGISAALATWDEPFVSGRNTLWRARIAAALNDPDQAVALLKRAVTEDWTARDNPHRDPFLQSLRGHSGFEEFVSSGN